MIKPHFRRGAVRDVEGGYGAFGRRVSRVSVYVRCATLVRGRNSRSHEVRTAEKLDALPPVEGHGHDIVRYREERDRFTGLRQLDEVPGLSDESDGVGDQVEVAQRGFRGARPVTSVPAGSQDRVCRIEPAPRRCDRAAGGLGGLHQSE